MRDRADNCVIVCSIENFDPMGVHTGDSVTVAPAQTLSDVEYQRMRDAAFACIRRIGVETGGSNIQFAINPMDGEMVVIEMNPRVSRSSALASKATGFPIAKIAARLAVGYTLDEIRNDITGETPASFEPAIDYVVTKVPRWAFEKFPVRRRILLGTRMQSVGEAMAIGRNFPESLQKALRSLETGRAGLNCDPAERLYSALTEDELIARASVATPDRPFHLEAALRRGVPSDLLHRESGVDPWFLDQINRICRERARLESVGSAAAMHRRDWRRAKRLGFSDAQLAHLWGDSEAAVRAARIGCDVRATFKTVDTCAAEFAARTPYHYSTYEDTDEVAASEKQKVVILGSGPNRIGQGSEFDYCCVQASFALRPWLRNGNGQLQPRDGLDGLRHERPPVFRARHRGRRLEHPGRRVGPGQPFGRGHSGVGRPGTLKLSAPSHPNWCSAPPRRPSTWQKTRGTLERPVRAARYPAGRRGHCHEPGTSARHCGQGRVPGPGPAQLCPRGPGHGDCLCGRGRLAGDERHDDFRVARALARRRRPDRRGRRRPAPGGPPSPRTPSGNAVADGMKKTPISAVMEHVEEAGVHSGDSACVVPPPTLSAETVAVIEGHTRAIADALEVRGPLNVQFAVQRGANGSSQVFVIEANPRASRTVPFVSKATGVPLAKVAARVMAGANLAELRSEGLLREPVRGYVSVKEAVLPFDRFPDADSVLGPEMRSTGEVMGIDTSFGLAFAKSQLAAGDNLAEGGTVFFSVADRDKPAGLEAAARFVAAGFTIAATAGTAQYLEKAGVPVGTLVAKILTPENAGADAGEANAVGVVDALELIRSGKVHMVVNTPRGRGPRADGAYIRRAARQYKIPLVTTVAAARAAAAGVLERAGRPFTVTSLQEHHGER